MSPFGRCVETDITQCSNIDTIHSVIGETNLCKKLPGPTYTEVHITDAYPLIVSHKVGHVYVGVVQGDVEENARVAGRGRR